MKDFNCMELFVGAGGLALGLKNAGFNTLLMHEKTVTCCLTLRHNFPNVPVIDGDIKNEDGFSLLEKAGHDKSLGVDLIAGGPPCQGFSIAGKREITDVRNSLVSDFLRIVKDIQPKLFLLENVPGLLTIDNGQFFDSICNEIMDMNYSFGYKILNAADFGVPQARKRLIILGSRNTVPKYPVPTHFNPLEKDQSNYYTTCNEAISDLPVINNGENAMIYDKEPQNNYQKIMRENCKVLYNHETAIHKTDKIQYYGLFPIEGTQKDIHLNRNPTVREFARIQSFPDSFKFIGGKYGRNGSQMQQVGNAVPPLLAKAIGEQLLSYLASNS